MDSDGMLRHLAFFEELANLDESDATWREVAAGLVVLRFVDNWLASGPAVAAPDSPGMTAVLAAIDEISVGRPTRGILRSLVDAMSNARGTDIHVVTPRLMAYARALDFDAKWSLAIDVYRTIISHTEPVSDSETVIAAQLRLGFCLRQIGEIEESAVAYHLAGQLAERAGDMMGVLRARIGDAKIALLRGNLPQAESILDKTIDDASMHGLPAVESMALHDRANAAGFRGDHELAIRLAYRALDNAETERNRDRILYDIAVAFTRLGVRSAARDAMQVLAATAQEQYTRWAANIQLLAIACDDGMSTVFEKYRRELSTQLLPPALAAEFQYQTGRGYRMLGQTDVSANWLERAVATATQHGLNQILFETETELELLRSSRGTPSTVAPNNQPPLDLRQIADAIREMRQAATIAG